GFLTLDASQLLQPVGRHDDGAGAGAREVEIPRQDILLLVQKADDEAVRAAWIRGDRLGELEIVRRAGRDAVLQFRGRHQTPEGRRQAEPQTPGGSLDLLHLARLRGPVAVYLHLPVGRLVQRPEPVQRLAVLADGW